MHFFTYMVSYLLISSEIQKSTQEYVRIFCKWTHTKLLFDLRQRELQFEPGHIKPWSRILPTPISNLLKHPQHSESYLIFNANVAV